MVLIVDDEEFNILCIKSQLETMAFTCDMAQSGTSAIEMIKSRIKLALED